MTDAPSTVEGVALDGMKFPASYTSLGLSLYLSQIRKLVFPDTTTGKNVPKVTAVLGNPSCDLDSFISAVVLSYFYNLKTTPQQRPTAFVPLLNLPDVAAIDLWRLRPEFGVAVRGAIDGLKSQQSSSKDDDTRQRDKTLLEQLITIEDLRESSSALRNLRSAFRPSEKAQTAPSDPALDTILVDHNAISIQGIPEEDAKTRFNVVGCIDHHVEESYVPQTAQPRIITTGIGSCTSLVVRHLRDEGLWQTMRSGSDTDEDAIRQIAKLALTPILIDTNNLTGKGEKCSDMDRDIVAFLKDQIEKDFDHHQLFKMASTAKSESLNLLTMSEIFGRDYKEWYEGSNSSEVVIGISSLVKDIDWLVQHAGGQDKFVESILDYARNCERQLDILGMLTRAGDGKEVAIFSFSEQGKRTVEAFECGAGDLQLKPWNENDDLAQVLDKSIAAWDGGSWKIWWMGDTSKTRKQVAPLLRKAVKDQNSS